MIKKSFLLKIFNAACMQRWNDKLRPIELTELDKQAHKMMIAYILGKMKENKGHEVDWIRIIEGGIYEYILRATLTDIKPSIFHLIQEQSEYNNMIDWAFKEWELDDLQSSFIKEKDFRNYHKQEEKNINREILKAAHDLATHWEYDHLLEKFNQDNEGIADRHEQRKLALEKRGLHYAGSSLEKVVDFCGQLRYQVRWAHLHRVPHTSVLGHLLFVAIITYIMSLELGEKTGNAYSETRLYNNFFTGLFHDLPEALTRDIISPVKEIGIEDILKRIEESEMENKILKHFPNDTWKDEIRLFTGILKDDKGKPLSELGEFGNVYFAEGKYISLPYDDMTNFNEKSNRRRDGRTVRAADRLAAFIEAFVAIENGCSSGVFHEALYRIKSEFNIKKPQKEKKETPTPRVDDPDFNLMHGIYTEF